MRAPSDTTTRFSPLMRTRIKLYLLIFNLLIFVAVAIGYIFPSWSAAFMAGTGDGAGVDGLCISADAIRF